MSFGGAVMAAGGLIASFVANWLASQFGRNSSTKELLHQIRFASLQLLQGKDPGTFYRDYRALLLALVRMAGLQTLNCLMITIPMVIFYFLSTKCSALLSSEVEMQTSGWMHLGTLSS